MNAGLLITFSVGLPEQNDRLVNGVIKAVRDLPYATEDKWICRTSRA
jgi:hypothetical protein